MRLTRRQTHGALLGGLAALFGLRLPVAAAPVPAPVPGPVMVPLFDFAIAGGWYHGLGAALKAGLGPGTALTLRREADNPHDPNAIAVHGPDGARLGYVPRRGNAGLAARMDAGAQVRAEVLALTDGSPLLDDLVMTGLMRGDPLLRLWVEDRPA